MYTVPGIYMSLYNPRLLRFLPKVHLPQLLHRNTRNLRTREPGIRRGRLRRRLGQLQVVHRRNARDIQERQHAAEVQTNLIDPVAVIRKTEAATARKEFLHRG